MHGHALFYVDTFKSGHVDPIKSPKRCCVLHLMSGESPPQLSLELCCVHQAASYREFNTSKHHLCFETNKLEAPENAEGF